MPRLTLSENINRQWYLSAEVSIPEWLFGTNTKLPNQTDIFAFLEKLSDYVLKKTQIGFDAFTAKVRRVDFTKDLAIGRTKIIPTIKKLYEVHPPRFRRVIYDEQTVEFCSRGKKKGLAIKVYDKLSEMRSNKKKIENPSYLRNLLRLEASYRSSYYIEKIKKENELPNMSAAVILTIDVAEQEIFIAEEVISFENQIPPGVSSLDVLIANYGAKHAAILSGFMMLIKEYGYNFYEFSVLDYPPRTYRKHLSECKKAGIFHYE